MAALSSTNYLTTDELAAGRFELIAIDKLHESPLNPRKRFDQHKLIELADSIRRQGIITPLLVRPVQYLVSPGYEIAAGHRRYRAAQEAGVRWRHRRDPQGREAGPRVGRAAGAGAGGRDAWIRITT